MPAWAQAAAAVIIFAAGMSVNAFRSPGERQAGVVQGPEAARVSVAADRQADNLGVTREEFARLDTRLRAVERADVSRASYVQGTDRGTDSEDLQAQLAALKNQVAVDRKVDEFFRKRVSDTLYSNRDDINAIHETAQRLARMDEELADQRSVLRSAIVPGLAVRTALTTGGR